MICKRVTLIEILVVVAIIGILASLLLPTLGKARGKARLSVCLNNMKQISMGMSMYAEDNNGSAPHAFRTVENELEDAGLMSQSSGAWECPEDKGTWSYGGQRPIDNGISTTYEAQDSSYLMNEKFIAAVEYETDGDPSSGEKDNSANNIKNIDQIIEPHTFLWAGCAPLRGKWGGHDGFANLWHLNDTKWPIALADGHAVIMNDYRAPTTEMFGGNVENNWFGVKQHEGWYKNKLGL